MKFELILVVKLLGLSSNYLTQSLPSDDGATIQGAGISHCQADSINLDNYIPLYPDGELLNVQIFHRHGDRVANKFMPPNLQTKDTWNCPTQVEQLQTRGSGGANNIHSIQGNQCSDGSSYCTYNPVKRIGWNGNCYPGQLTQKGIDQLSTIGSNLREIYVNQLGFLPKYWHQAKDKIYVRSSDFTRTKQSAAALISGLFNPSTGDLLTSPIKMEVLPAEYETMLPSRTCPKMINMSIQFSKTTELQMYYYQTDNLRKYLQSFFTPTSREESFWTQLYLDTLVSRHCHAMQPICSDDGSKCVTETHLNQLLQAANGEMKTWFGGNSLRNKGFSRVQIGPMLWEIKNNLLKAPSSLSDNSKPDAQRQPRLKIYSGHDATIGALLGSLDAETVEWPPYASTFIVELWNPKKRNSQVKNGDLSIRIIYNGKPLNMSWCPKGVCSVKDYLLYLQNQLGFVDNENIQLPQNGTSTETGKTWDYFDDCFSA